MTRPLGWGCLNDTYTFGDIRGGARDRPAISFNLRLSTIAVTWSVPYDTTV
jgi:hypothetical protein